MGNVGNLARIERETPSFLLELVQMVNEFGQGGAARYYGVSQSAISQFLHKRGATQQKMWVIYVPTPEGSAARQQALLTEQGAVESALMREKVVETFDQEPHFFTPDGIDLGAVR